MVTEVKKAVQKDAKDIFEITKEAFKQYAKCVSAEIKLEAIDETLDDVKGDIETKEVVLAFVDGVPAGSARIEIKDNEAYLSRFGVRSAYQKHGIGGDIMDFVDKLMKEKGVKQLKLHTASKAFSTIIFYYKRNFYIHSTNSDKGYIRALICKDYD